MRTFISILLLALSFNSLCQDFDVLYQSSRKLMRSNKDSSLFLINRAIDLVKEKDTLNWTKALRHKNEIYFHFERNPSELIPRADSVILLSRRINNQEEICNVLIDLGYYFRYNNNFAKAEEYYNESLNIATIFDLTVSLAEANNALGVVNYYKGNHIKSLEYYRAAMSAYMKEGDSVKISKSYNNIAIIYKIQGDNENAIDYYKKAIGIYERLEDKSPGILRNRYSNLARAYQKMQQYDLAEKCIKRMIVLDKEDRGSTDIYLISMLSLVENFSFQGRTEEALAMSREVERKADSMNIPDFIPFIYLRKAWIFQDASVPDSALFYLNKSEAGIEDDNDLETLYELYKNKSEVLLALKRYNESTSYGIRALEIAKETGVKEWIFHVFEILYQGYKARGDFANALYHHEQFQTYADSLWNEERSIKVGLKQNEIALVQADAKNNFLESEAAFQATLIRNQRAIIVGSVLIVLLLLIIAILFRKQLTERKRLLLKIESQANKLSELDQAKSRFFANVSHDLRSPLTLILGALDRISERDYEILDKESRDLLSVGYKNGKRLLYLADEIMDLTKLEEGKIKLELQHVKIVPYLRLLTKMFSSAADIKEIDLNFAVEVDEEVILQLDPHQFEKIIYNLLSNAIKFTPDKGKVDIALKANKKYVEIEVSDSGSGISQESINYIFDRFYQAKSKEFQAQEGVGIGLSLVKELVELHQGHIEVASSEEGTRFLVSFPFKESNWVSQAIIPERSLDVIARNSLWVDLQDEERRVQIASLRSNLDAPHSILIVEDHKELRSYLENILSRDFRVCLASNGAHALEILQSEKIELIITDLMMPYMDGFELIDHLKKDKTLKKIPVLIVSARTDRDEKLRLISKGAEEVISKPFDKEVLVARIKNILDRDWDSNKKLTQLYNETAEDFEKNVMARLERLIIKRINDPHLTVLDLADEMAASESKVYRMIKKISGLTPYELIKEIRWQYLENHIKNYEIETATEAAKLIGMSNVSSFSEQYAKRFGHSVKKMLSK